MTHYYYGYKIEDDTENGGGFNTTLDDELWFSFYTLEDAQEWLRLNKYHDN